MFISGTREQLSKSPPFHFLPFACQQKWKTWIFGKVDEISESWAACLNHRFAVNSVAVKFQICQWSQDCLRSSGRRFCYSDKRKESEAIVSASHFTCQRNYQSSFRSRRADVTFALAKNWAPSWPLFLESRMNQSQGYIAVVIFFEGSFRKSLIY